MCGRVEGKALKAFFWHVPGAETSLSSFTIAVGGCGILWVEEMSLHDSNITSGFQAPPRFTVSEARCATLRAFQFVSNKTLTYTKNIRV